MTVSQAVSPSIQKLCGDIPFQTYPNFLRKTFMDVFEVELNFFGKEDISPHDNLLLLYGGR